LFEIDAGRGLCRIALLEHPGQIAADHHQRRQASAPSCRHPTTRAQKVDIDRSRHTPGRSGAGDLGRAIPLLEATLADCIRLLSDDHPLTQTVRRNLRAITGR
jgi:hypothetical protein